MHVRIKQDSARIWTSLPTGTTGATELTDEQVQTLTKAVNALPKKQFSAHQKALKAGKTVKANATGMVAQAIQAVLDGTPAPAKKATSPRKSSSKKGKGGTPAQVAAAAKAREAKAAKAAAKAQEQEKVATPNKRPEQAAFEAELVLVGAATPSAKQVQDAVNILRAAGVAIA